MIGTDCIGSCKSNYHTIMATTALYYPNLIKYPDMFWSLSERQKVSDSKPDKSRSWSLSMRHNVFAVLPFSPPCRDHYLYATVFLPAQPTCRHSYVIKHLSVPRYVDIIIRTWHSICQYPDRTLQNAFSLASIVHLFYWFFLFYFVFL